MIKMKRVHDRVMFLAWSGISPCDWWAITPRNLRHYLFDVWCRGDGVGRGYIVRAVPVWDVIFQSGDS